MKRVITASQNDIVTIKIDIAVNYSIANESSLSVAASKEFDSMDLSSLSRPIINLPQGQRINTHSEAYNNFIEAVNKIDELLELRGIEVVGEHESDLDDSEATYRELLFNCVKDVDGVYYSITIANFLRIAAHKETRSSRRDRSTKLENAVNSGSSKKANNGVTPEVGEFQSIVVRASVSDPSKTNIANKEFYTYRDAVECVDRILDTWMIQEN